MSFSVPNKITKVNDNKAAEPQSGLTPAQRGKRDAYDLAILIYDMFKERQEKIRKESNNQSS